MISIDEQPPPDPSSSHHNQNQNHLIHQQKQEHQVSHEDFAASVSDIDLLKSTDANFSIRDYVFESRSKDVARNWPFSVKSLQLCLNYGVKNLLPPFQSLDSVRNSSPVSVLAVENRLPNEDETVDDLANEKSNSQPTVMKFEQVEETLGSKVCPVCKTFSSSSNTTLNAHIDRCLYEESGVKSTADVKLVKTVKHRIKPRKTRLMVDVYKTALHCTIEELDRRNGTNWATNSSFPDQELEFQVEEKKKPPREPRVVPSVADHDGAVYIDKNGKKVRILSMTKSSKLDDDNIDDDDDDDDEARVLTKGRKCANVVIKKKKKASEAKNSKKILKDCHNSKKLRKKGANGQKENVVLKESGAKPMKDQVDKQRDDLVIARPPWACSKRSGFAKKRADRKEGTGLDGSWENRIRLKGSVFSSLDRSLSASQERNAGSKLVVLKRKFSAPQISEDSLKQKARTEDDTCKKTSFETDVMEVKRMKSATSESSNDDSESARTEDGNSIGNGNGMGQDLMGFRNTLDDEFPETISELNDRFNSRERTLDDIIIEHSTEKQGSYFDEVDPIPIPGPPGSFLPPSPGAEMGSEEEPQANSSLTTMSRVHSSEEYHHHHEIMNQDFVSGSSISTVSSPTFARTARLDTKSVNNNSNHNTSDFRSGDAFVTEKSSTPCCCSRKEGAFFHQESYVSKERVTEPNRLRSELFPLVNHLILPPPPQAVKLPVASPTTPVLRLMGKNLTVVNTDDEQQLKPPCSSPVGQYQQFQKLQNEKRDAFVYGYPLNNHITFSHNQNVSMNQRFNLYPPKSHSDLRSVTVSMDKNSTKEIIVVDDSSENEHDDDDLHKFKEPMIASHAFGFTHPYGNRGLQTSSSLRDVANDGDRGRWVSKAYYPRSFS